MGISLSCFGCEIPNGEFPFVEVILHADVALAHARRSHRNSLRGVPDGAVADVTGEHVGRQAVEGEVRIFDRPHGIALSLIEHLR